MGFMRAAFEKIIPDAIQAESWYVVLIEEQRVYLGPWEGGTWGSARTVECYREYPGYDLAEKAAKDIKELANEMSANARREHGEHCQRTMDWLEQRGLEADYLPEPDGESTYRVLVSQTVPENYYPSRSYE